MNKKPLAGSFSETDEAMQEARFAMSGFGVNKTAGGEVNLECMVETNM
jgi:hypothetical protein